MTRFRFRLETVLKMREQQEQHHQRRVAEALHLRQHCQDRIRELDEARRVCSQELRTLSETGRLDMARIAALRFFGSQLGFQKIDMQQRLRLVDEEVARRRRGLAEAHPRHHVPRGPGTQL